ncbi:MAG: VanZ family protein [Chloroflexota bacterium]|nr:VanZ family protein [Chloroflexota bacterium]
MHRRGWIWWALAIAIAAWLSWMTLRPNPTVATDLAPLTEPAAARGISPHVLISLAGNVVVFVPLGAALAFALGDKPAGRRLLLATLAGAALSLCIELAQIAIPSRVSALDDWLLNTVGTAVGALVSIQLRNQFFSEKPGFSSLNKGDKK